MTNNVCYICKATIDLQWSLLQVEIEKSCKLNDLLNKEFIKRCIYCYKSLVETVETREHEWYKTILDAIERRYK